MVDKVTKFKDPLSVKELTKPRTSHAAWYAWKNLNTLTHAENTVHAVSPVKSKDIVKGGKPSNLLLEAFDFSEVPDYAVITGIKYHMTCNVVKATKKKGTPKVHVGEIQLKRNGKNIKSGVSEFQIKHGAWNKLEKLITLKQEDYLTKEDLSGLSAIIKWGTKSNNVPATFKLNRCRLKIYYTIIHPVFSAEVLHTRGINNHEDFKVRLAMNSDKGHSGYTGRLKLPPGITIVSSKGQGDVGRKEDYLLWYVQSTGGTVENIITLHADVNYNTIALDADLIFGDAAAGAEVVQKLEPINLVINDSEIVMNIYDSRTNYFLPENVKLNHNDTLSLVIQANWRNTFEGDEREVIIGFERDKYNRKSLVFEDDTGELILEAEEKLIQGVVWTEYRWNVTNLANINNLWIDSELVNDTKDTTSFRLHIYCVDEFDRYFNVSFAPKPINAPIPKTDDEIEHYAPSDDNYTVKSTENVKKIVEEQLPALVRDNTPLREIKLPLTSIDPYFTAIVLDSNELSRMGDNVLYQFVVPYFCEDKEGKYGRDYPLSAPLYDTGRNHRIAVYCDNPCLIFEDNNAHTFKEYWNNIGFLLDETVTYRCELQIITENKCTYSLNYNFPLNSLFFIEFLVFSDDFNEFRTLDKKFITFNNDNEDNQFSFEELDLNSDSTVRLEYNPDKDKVYYYKNGELFNRVLVEGEDAGVILKDAHNLLKTISLGCKDIQYNTEEEIDFIAFGDVKIESLNELDDDDLINRATSNLEDLDYSIMCVETNDWENLRVNFRYNTGDRVILFIFGEPLNYFPESIASKFLQPCVVEIEDNNSNSDYVPYKEVPMIAKENDDDFQLVLSPDSPPLLFYDFKNENNVFEQDHVINGLRVQIEGEISGRCILSAGIFVKHKQYIQSAIFDTDENEIGTLFDKGGYNDTWRVNRRDVNSFGNIGVVIYHNNLDNDEVSSVLIKNIIFSVYHEKMIESEFFCRIGEEEELMVDTREVGMFINDISLPYGLESDVKYYNVLGSDTQLPYSQTLKQQEVRIDFTVHQNNLNDSSDCLSEITRLFTSRRTEDNTPIPKLITFSNLPNKIFRYIMKKSIDSRVNIDMYKCTAVLEIPTGLADSIEDTVTGTQGIVKSLVSVYPNLKISDLVYDSDKECTHITITERKTRQELVIDDSDLEITRKFSNQDYLSLNCAERELTLYKYDSVNDEYSSGVDVTDAVTKISDWFILDDIFDFEATNARIIYVSYNEK